MRTDDGGGGSGPTPVPARELTLAGRRSSLRRFTMWRVRLLCDVVALAVAGAIALWPVHADALAFDAVAFAVAALVIIAGIGGYRRSIKLAALDEVGLVARSSAGALLVAGAVAVVGERPTRDLVIQALLSCVLLLVGRTVSYGFIRSSRMRGHLTSRTAIIGAGRVGCELVDLLRRHREYGLEPVGIIDDVTRLPDGSPVLGTAADLERIVVEHGITRLIVAFGPVGEQDLVGALRVATHLPLEVYVVPRFFELGLVPTGPRTDEIWGIPLIPVRRAALQAEAWFVKRLVDVVVSGLALVVLSPLLGLLALGVRFSSPGPVFFRQRRIGQHGKEIDVLKFRSMRVNEQSDTQWSVVDDPRLTPLGRWLRRLSIDELPQLINVFRGEMSLIGPRPERPHFVDQYANEIRGYADRHRLPVGLTGLAQVHGLRGDTSIAERARFDNYYIEHWSPLLDVKIVARTAAAVARDAMEAGRRDDPTSPTTEPPSIDLTEQEPRT